MLKASGPYVPAQGVERRRRQRVELADLVRLELAELGDVTDGSHHQVSRRVWELVEQDEAVLASSHHQAVGAELICRLRAEHAPVLVPGLGDVLESPGSPDGPRHDAGSSAWLPWDTSWRTWSRVSAKRITS